MAATPSAMAADGEGNYAIWGAGGRSCNQFSITREDAGGRQTFKDFLMGYLTAYNTVTSQTYNALGSFTLPDALGWLDTYCAEHRMDSFERAVTQLVISRHEQRQQSAHVSSKTWGRGAQAPPETPATTPEN